MLKCSNSEMEKDSNSWLRRANFSHTVCHRLDSARLASIPSLVHQESTSKLEPRQKLIAADSQIQQTLVQPPLVEQRPVVERPNPIVVRPRSLSPVPRVVISNEFEEAKSDCKRFSSPCPQRKESLVKGIQKKFSRHESLESKLHSPLTHIGTMRFQEKTMSRKDSGWTKLFDNGGGRVNALEVNEEHTVDMSKLLLGQRFARGLHSRLYHGIYKDEPVAVKMIRIPDDDEDGNLGARLEKQFNREVTLLARLRHPNIIKFVAGCKMPPIYCIITEYLSEGSLRSHLHKLEHKSLPLKKLVGIALDIARGMEYIHSQGIIHRDLKPENVLINQDFHMKLADFGIACDEAYCDMLADDPGTYRWMAPEMIKLKPYGRKVDVYGFGLVLWEMVSGAIPYEDMSPAQAAFAVVHKNLRPDIPVGCPAPMQALIEQCWSSNPDKRPEFSQIVKVLEHFNSSLAADGTLKLVQNSMLQDNKKGLLYRIQKLGPSQNTGPPMPKPKFM